MDSNNDGKLSASELASWSATNISENEAKLLIQQYDKNGDGLLDQNEFNNLKQQIFSDQRNKEEEKQNNYNPYNNTPSPNNSSANVAVYQEAVYGNKQPKMQYNNNNPVSQIPDNNNNIKYK